MAIANSPIQQLSTLYVTNLQVTWASTSTLTIAAGQARDSTNAMDIALTEATTLNGATTGANGLDTGSLANSTFYAVHVIGSSTNQAQPAVLLSTSATAPYLPTGYDAFRRIGWVLTNGSAQFLKQFTFGNGNVRTTWYDAVITELNAQGSATYAALSLASSVPSTSQMAYLNWSLLPATPSNSALLRPTDSDSTTNQALYASVAGQENGGQLLMNTNSARSIDYKTSEATDDLTLLTAGYIDFV